MINNLEVKIINMESATHRREMIRQIFDRSSFDWSIFTAHTSLDTAEISYSSTEILKTFGRTLSPPQQGVWSSHYFAIKTFLDHSAHDYLLVFEDDVIFDVALPVDRLIDYMAKSDIHYMRLFGMYNAPAVRITAWYDRSILRYKSSPSGTQAYLLSKEGAARMISSLKTINSPIDLAMDQFLEDWIANLFPIPLSCYRTFFCELHPHIPSSSARRDRSCCYLFAQDIAKAEKDQAEHSACFFRHPIES